MINPQTYENDSSLAWKRLKLNSSKPFYLALCQALAAYRENEAKRLNRPRKHIMRDEIVLEIAANVPETAEEMAKMRGLPQGFANGRMGKDILKVIAEVKTGTQAHILFCRNLMNCRAPPVPFPKCCACF